MEPTVRITTDANNVVTVWMDRPDKPVNAMSPQMLADLGDVVSALEQNHPTAVIFTSAKTRSFNAGADLFEIRKMKPEQTAQYLADGQKLYDRIAALTVPTVAAINGDCMGGGYELALACRYRVAADESSVSIGLPEVKIGLIPAWGGSTRLPRIIGLTKALPILLQGKTMPPRKALRAGLVDEVVRPEALLSAARRIALSGAPARRPSWVDRSLARIAKVREKILDTARRQTLEMTYGNYPAPLRLIDVVRAGYTGGFEAGLQAERQALVDLTSTDACRNLLRIFFLRQGAKKWAAEQIHAKPAEIKYAAVIGGGTMGAGIAHSLIRAGVRVRLVEVDAKAASAALGRVRKLLDEDVSAGRLDALAARHAFYRLSPTTDWSGLELADVVIEAVVEKMDAKREVFAELDKLTGPSAVLASNTSSLRITEMAQATTHANRLIGLHFFNPVAKMPLVEVVRAADSDDQSLATGVGVVNRIGKTPILVNDSPGFLVNRILIPYLSEALRTAHDGVPIPTIDLAMKKWGMPMGPFELLDEIGLDVGFYVLRSLSGKLGERAAVPDGIEKAIERGWLGKKTGRGFYLHGKKRKAKLPLHVELVTTLGWTVPEKPKKDSPEDQQQAAALEEQIQWRLVLPMINETARLLEDDVTDSTDAIDLATVLGLGLAPFRGGIVQFANTVGAEQIVRRLDELAAKHGPRFEPAEMLRELAHTHRSMSQLATMDKSSPAAAPQPQFHSTPS